MQTMDDNFGQMEIPKNMSEELVLKQNKRKRLLVISSFSIVLLIVVIMLVVSLPKKSNEEKNLVNVIEQNSDNSKNDDDSFIEKEQPELNEETKALISKLQREPTLENYINLRDVVIKNYNAVSLERKEN